MSILAQYTCPLMFACAGAVRHATCTKHCTLSNSAARNTAAERNMVIMIRGKRSVLQRLCKGSLLKDQSNRELNTINVLKMLNVLLVNSNV